MGAAVRADKTLMLGLAKPACVLPPGSECFGEPLLGDKGCRGSLSRRLNRYRGSAMDAETACRRAYARLGYLRFNGNPHAISIGKSDRIW
jgi:hypothetical protein